MLASFSRVESHCHSRLLTKPVAAEGLQAYHPMLFSSGLPGPLPQMIKQEQPDTSAEITEGEFKLQSYCIVNQNL